MNTTNFPDVLTSVSANDLGPVPIQSPCPITDQPPIQLTIPAIVGATHRPKASSPAPSTRLRAIASRLRNHPRRTVADIVRAGRLLTEAKQLLTHGRFNKWVASETTLNRAFVSQAMLAHQRIKAPIDLLVNVKASAARVLASKKVSRSTKLTSRALSAEPDRAGMIGLRAVQSAISTIDPSAVHNLILAKESAAEALCRQLLALEADKSVSSVHLSFDHDAEESPHVAVTILGEGTARRSLSRETLAEAVAAISGEELRKRCPKCERELTPASFSKENHYCKKCERERVGAYARAKRAANRDMKQKIAEMK